MLVFLFGIIFTHGVTYYREETGNSSPSYITDVSNPLGKYWSTVPRSMATLFMAVTGGISWVEVVHPLSDLGQASVALFVGYVAFVQFAVLNVLTGVFCQNAIDSAQHDQDLVTQSILQKKEMYINRLRQIFRELDTDESGTLTIDELKYHLCDEKVRAYFNSLELDISDVKALFKLMDADGGDEIDAEEFISSCLRLRGGARGVDLAKLTYDQRRLARRLDEYMVFSIRALRSLSGRASVRMRTESAAPFGAAAPRAHRPTSD